MNDFETKSGAYVRMSNVFSMEQLPPEERVFSVTLDGEFTLAELHRLVEACEDRRAEVAAVVGQVLSEHPR